MEAEIGIAIVKGFGYGTAVAILIAILFIPASYVANRYIHHSTWMRVVLIIVAVIGSIFIFITMLAGKLFGLQVVNYLGFLPLMLTTGSGTMDFLLEPLLQKDLDHIRVAENYSRSLTQKDGSPSQAPVPQKPLTQGPEQ